MLKSLSISLVLVLFFTSCVFDNLSNCQRTSISFVYSADGDENVIHEYIKNATLLIYDNNGKLVSSSEVDPFYLHNGAEMSLDVKPGDYTVVCWGNVNENSKISSEDQLSQGKIQAPNYITKKEIKSNDKLYFAKKEIKVLGNNKPITHPIEFSSAHINLKITAKGFKFADEATVPQLLISGVMPQLDFSMNPAGDLTDYTPEMTKLSDGIFTATTQLLRFSEDNAIQLAMIDPTSNKHLLQKERGVLKNILEEAANNGNPTDFSKQELYIHVLLEYLNDGIMYPEMDISVVEWSTSFTVPGTKKKTN